MFFLLVFPDLSPLSLQSTHGSPHCHIEDEFRLLSTWSILPALHNPRIEYVTHLSSPQLSFLSLYQPCTMKAISMMAELAFVEVVFDNVFCFLNARFIVQNGVCIVIGIGAIDIFKLFHFKQGKLMMGKATSLNSSLGNFCICLYSF